jgi:hypothetical protein
MQDFAAKLAMITTREQFADVKRVLYQGIADGSVSDADAAEYERLITARAARLPRPEPPPRARPVTLRAVPKVPEPAHPEEPKHKRDRAAFERSKCAWWKGWGSNKQLPGLAPRLLAPFIADCFHYERWRDTGLLDAGGQDEYGGGIGMRYLSKESGLSLRSVTSAILTLEKAGALRVERGSFNPETGRWATNKYIAVHFTKAQQTEPKTGPPVAPL